MKSLQPRSSQGIRSRIFSLTLATIIIFSNSGPKTCAQQPTRTSPASQSCANWPQSLSAWWPFDELSGSVINDIRNGNHGTPKPNGTMGNPNGPGTVGGKVNSATRFYMNTYHQVPSNPSLNFGTGSFSMDAWVRLPATTSQGIYPIVDKLLNIPYPLSSTGYALYVQRTQAGLELKLRIGVGGKKAETYTSTTLIPPHPWNHIAVTVDRTSNVGTFYVNGIADAVTFTPVPGNINNNLDLLIGKSRTGQTAIGGLYLDELELFQAAIPSSSVQAIYNAQSAGKCKTCDLAVSVNSSGVYLSQQPTSYTVTLKSVGGLACAGTFPVHSSVTAVGQVPPPTLTFQSAPNSPPWTNCTIGGFGHSMNCTAQLSQTALAPGDSISILLDLLVQNSHTNFGVFYSVNGQFTDSYSGNNSQTKQDAAQP